jgi:hypothetical protein
MRLAGELAPSFKMACGSDAFGECSYFPAQNDEPNPLVSNGVIIPAVKRHPELTPWRHEELTPLAEVDDLKGGYGVTADRRQHRG